MASITTAIPSGQVEQWCILPKWTPWEVNSCASNFANGTTHHPAPKESDFYTICCEGPILSRSRSLMLNAVYADESPEWLMSVDDLICCPEAGSKQGSFFGPPGNIHDGIGTTCTAGIKPTPLVSMAALNSDNVALYEYTLTPSAQPEVSCDPAAVFGCEGGSGVLTGTPYCLWMNTARSSNPTVAVTVPAADVTTAATPDLISWGAGETGVVDPSFWNHGHSSTMSSSTDGNVAVITGGSSSVLSSASNTPTAATTTSGGHGRGPDTTEGWFAMVVVITVIAIIFG